MANTLCMLAVLIAVLMLLLILLLLYFKFEVLQPAVLMVGTMLGSVLLAFLSVDRWELQFGMLGFTAITIAMFCFSVGSVWCGKFYNDKDLIEQRKFFGLFNRDVNGKVFIVLLIVMAVLAWFSFSEMENLATSLGNRNGYLGIIKTIRPAIEQHKVVLSRWMNYRHVIAQMIAYSYLYVFIRETLIKPWRVKTVVFLLPVVFYLPFVILTTGRMALICLVIYAIAVTGILYEKKYGGTLKSRVRMICGTVFGGVLFVMLFFVLGNFTGKTINADRTPMVILSHYAGCSIPALDYLLNQISTETVNVGETTFVGIYRILNRLGMNLPEVQIFLPFVQFSGIDTNVYTAEGRYIRDFGYVGMAGIMGLLGVGYTYLYEKAKRSSSMVFHVVYASVCYPLFLSSIDERFFLDIVGTAVLYLIVLAWGLNHIIFSSK